MNSSAQCSPPSGKDAVKYFTLGWVLKICVVCFYLGYRNAINEGANSDAIINAAGCPTEISPELQKQIDGRVKEELASRIGTHSKKDGASSKTTTSSVDALFPKTTSNFATGALRVSRDELMKTYDFGVPLKKDTDIDSIILYNTQSSLPPKKKDLAIKGDNGALGKASVSDAMQNCDAMNVIFTSLQGKAQTPECQVIIGNFVSIICIKCVLTMNSTF